MKRALHLRGQEHGPHVRKVHGDDALGGSGDDEHVREAEERDQYEERLAALAVLLRFNGVGRAQLRDEYLCFKNKRKQSNKETPIST